MTKKRYQKIVLAATAVVFLTLSACTKNAAPTANGSQTATANNLNAAAITLDDLDGQNNILLPSGLISDFVRQGNLDALLLPGIVTEVQKKAGTDAAFKTKLMADPKAVLSEEGIQFKSNESVKVLEISPDSNYLILDDRNLAKLHPDQTTAKDKKEKNKTEKLMLGLRDKAVKDKSFKDELVKNPKEQLMEIGVPEAIAATFTVLDLEPNAHYLLLLPSSFYSQSDKMKTQMSIMLAEPSLNQFLRSVVNRVLDSLGTPLDIKLKDSLLTLIGAHQANTPAPIVPAVDLAFAGVEAACFWPRFWQPCGISKTEIATVFLTYGFGLAPNQKYEAPDPVIN